MSDAQKEKLRAAQLRYIAQDPRWEAHKAKLAEAQQKPEQRRRLSDAQLAYMAQDPRWLDHEVRFRQAAADCTRLTILPEEIEIVVALRSKGRNFEYIGEQLCISDKIIRRELKALGISTKAVKPEKRARRGKGYWRCYDEA